MRHIASIAILIPLAPASAAEKTIAGANLINADDLESNGIGAWTTVAP